MLVPEPHWPKGWWLPNVEFSIQCVPWREPKEGGPDLSFGRCAPSDFKADKLQVGWKAFITSEKVKREDLADLLSPEGYLLIRAEVKPTSTLQCPLPARRAPVQPVHRESDHVARGLASMLADSPRAGALRVRAASNATKAEASSHAAKLMQEM
jgi:hypothetical protein